MNSGLSNGLWLDCWVYGYEITIIWLVVWNIYFSILGIVIPTGEVIFFRGRYTTNQCMFMPNMSSRQNQLKTKEPQGVDLACSNLSENLHNRQGTTHFGHVHCQSLVILSATHIYSGWWFGTFFIFPYIGNFITCIYVYVYPLNIQKGTPPGPTNHILAILLIFSYFLFILAVINEFYWKDMSICIHFIKYTYLFHFP